MQEIINFYKTFDRYNDCDDEIISEQIEQCYKNNQFKVFKENNKIYGFVNWAYLDDESLNYFLNTGEIEDFNCGKNVIHLDLLAKKNIKQIYKWSQKNLAEKIGVGNKTQWIRLNKDNGIRNIVYKTIKESWNG
jgi:hemolysin-activating ACP:hemolysin acyltransferase